MTTMIQTASKLTVDELKTAIINIDTNIATLPSHYSEISNAMVDALMLKLSSADFVAFIEFLEKTVYGV